MIRLAFASTAIIALFAVAARLAGTGYGVALGIALGLVGLVVLLLEDA